MSFGNKNCDASIVYSLLNPPPVKGCGGTLDENGIDSYWGQSLTLQSEAENADITLIMQKYAKTGIINAKTRDNPIYGDFSTVPDFQQAQSIVAKAYEQFEALDGTIRSRFHNDPAEFLAFVHDEANYSEAVKLGISIPVKSETPPVTPPSNPLAGDTPPA